MKRFIYAFIVCMSACLFAQQEDKGPYAGEKRRRASLRLKWHGKKITSEQYHKALYAPTKAGAINTIKAMKKGIASNKAKLAKSKSKTARKKYITSIKLYGEHIKILEGILKRLENEEYDEMCMEDFQDLLKNEKRFSRLTSSRISRSWPLTIELYPSLYKKPEAESGDSNETEKSDNKR